MEKEWFVYFLVLTDRNQHMTYVGKTDNLHRRIRQHNCILSGGAKLTSNWVKRGFAWEYALVLHGFQTEKQALQFEYSLKAKCSSRRNRECDKELVKNALVTENGCKTYFRILEVIKSLSMDNWTSNATDSKSIPLLLEWWSFDMKPFSLESYLRIQITEQFVSDETRILVMNSRAKEKTTVSIYNKKRKSV